MVRNLRLYVKLLLALAIAYSVDLAPLPFLVPKAEHARIPNANNEDSLGIAINAN